MSFRRVALSTVVSVFVFAACDKTEESVPSDAATDATADAASSDASVDATTGDATADAAIGDAASDGATDAVVDAAIPGVDLYDPALVPKFEVTLDPAAIATFSSTAEADKKKWVHGTFRYGNTVLADVGVRRKGSSTFRALPQKSSLKIRFDKYVAGQRLNGLTELTLNNMVGDETGIIERLAYHVFRTAGLPAQKANSATVAINGENYGLYANIETPNADFLQRVFGANANTLYEAEYGVWAPNDGSYSEEVGDGTSHDLQALFTNVAATADANLPAGVAGTLDVDEWLRFSATEAVIGDRDGYGFGIYGSHNYFLAGGKDGRMSLVPWSLDLSFEDNPQVSATAPKPAYPTGEPTLLVRCKQSPTCWNAYKAQVTAVTNVFRNGNLGALAQTYHGQIDALQRNDPKRESTIGTYDAQTATLFAWIAARPGIVDAQIAAP